MVLIVINKHNLELIMSASPMKYSGTIETLYKNHWIVTCDILGIGTRKSNTHGVRILFELSTSRQGVHLKKDMT